MATQNSINGNQSLKTTDSVAFNGLTVGGDAISGVNSGDNAANSNYSGLASSKQDALGFTAESSANKSNDIVTDAASTTKYPNVKAIKDYADSLVIGLLDYRGGYDASGNTYPTTGGSGVAGAIMKGDMWVISTGGTLGGSAIQAGDSIIAEIDTPGSTSANWNPINSNISYVPEDTANKATTMTGNTTSNTLFLTAKAIYDWATGLFATKSQVHFVGTTSIAADRTSAAMDLTGITSIDGRSASCTGNAGTVTNGVYTTNKDATGGYAGLTLFKINFKNVLNTFTSFFTNSNTAARTYTFPDKNGTVAMTSDISVGITYSEVTGTSQAMAINTGYIMNNAGLVTGTLPATATLGSIIEVVGKGAGGWKVAQNASQTIHFGTSNSTAGTGGYVASTNTYDTLKLLCTTANTDFVVLSSIGNITVV